MNKRVGDDRRLSNALERRRELLTHGGVVPNRRAAIGAVGVRALGKSDARLRLERLKRPPGQRDVDVHLVPCALGLACRSSKQVGQAGRPRRGASPEGARRVSTDCRLGAFVTVAWQEARTRHFVCWSLQAFVNYLKGAVTVGLGQRARDETSDDNGR